MACQLVPGPCPSLLLCHQPTAVQRTAGSPTPVLAKEGREGSAAHVSGAVLLGGAADGGVGEGVGGLGALPDHNALHTRKYSGS